MERALRLALLFVGASLAVAAACASGGAGSAPPAVVTDAREPEWVSEGSGIRGVWITGVGTATIPRPENVLISLAGARARLEVAKRVELVRGGLASAIEAEAAASPAKIPGQSAIDPAAITALEQFAVLFREAAELDPPWISADKTRVFVRARLHARTGMEKAFEQADVPGPLRPLIEKHLPQVLYALAEVEKAHRSK